MSLRDRKSVFSSGPVTLSCVNLDYGSYQKLQKTAAALQGPGETHNIVYVRCLPGGRMPLVVAVTTVIFITITLEESRSLK